MSINLLVVSTSPNTSEIVKTLEHLSSSQINIKVHVGDARDDIKASALSRMNTKRGKLPHIFSNSRFSGAALELMQSPDFNTQLEQFIEQLHRRSEVNSFNSHKLLTLGDYSDYYHILADAVANLLTQQNVNHCLFFHIPHLTYDTIIYQVAKSLNIPTTILTQSIFPNKYFSMKNISDNGKIEFKTPKNPYYISPANATTTPFYMGKVKQERGQPGKLTTKAYINILAFIALQRPQKILNIKYILKILSRVKHVYEQLPAWRDPFAKFFHEDSLSYFEHIIGYENNSIDYKQQYIYFPLQLQPEMTTSSIGGKFHDQAFAIESLARKLPPGIKIYVKENPKQAGYMRGPMFFHRLHRIDAVEILPSWANTHELTKNAMAIATITGTVGWEALQLNKPAIIFGSPWYLSLPGVTQFDENFDWVATINQENNPTNLEQAAGYLLEQAHTGVIDRHYEVIAKDYDKKTNIQKVAKTIVNLILGNESYTFKN